MLESMAAGIPVVATSVGGNTELGDDNRALLIPPNDEEALAGAMQKLLEQSQFRSELARKARIFANENFSLESIGNQYACLYRELLELKGRRTLEPKAKSISFRDSRIKVAFVAPTLRYVGGQAVQADLLVRYWANDPKVEARFIAVDPSFHRSLAWIESIPLLRTLCREPLYIHSLWKNLKGVDVAHMFSASYSSFLVAPLPAWLIARLRGNRTLINYRSGECRDHLRKSRIAREVLGKTDLLVAPSGYLIDIFREFGLDARVVPNLVDLSQFSYRVRRPLRPHLVCTRGFHPYYGIDLVVRAFAEIQKAHPDARLDLVGGGPMEAEIRKLVQKLGIPGVQFTGVASRANIGRCYDQADIFINASHLDNMPVSVLEAFASGTPVISTSPESMPYLVDHGRTGLLSPTGDFHALAQNVLHVLEDSELALKLVENGHEESKKFCWNVVRRQWLDIYSNLLSRTGESARELAPIA
jgi:glycosyltransferase involved in cell wall biosynthesis